MNGVPLIFKDNRCSMGQGMHADRQRDRERLQRVAPTGATQTVTWKVTGLPWAAILDAPGATVLEVEVTDGRRR